MDDIEPSGLSLVVCKPRPRPRSWSDDAGGNRGGRRSVIRKLWRLIAETSAARIYGLALGLVTLTLTARLLGPDGRGVLAAVMSLSAFLALAGGLSLGEVSQHRIQLRKREEWLPYLLGAQLFFTLVLGFISVVGALLLYWMTDGALIKNVPAICVILGFVMVPLIIWDNLSRYLLSGANRLRDYNKAQFIGSTVGFVLTLFFLLYLETGVLGVLVASLLGGAFTQFLKLLALWKAAERRARLAMSDITGMLGGALKLHLHAVGGILLIEANVLMLNHLGSLSDVGHFQLAFQMMMMMLIIPQSAFMALSSLVAEKGPDRAWPDQRRLMLYLLGLMTLLAGVAFLMAPYAVLLLAGASFEPSISAFRYLLLLMLGLTLTLVLAPQWFGRGIFLPKSIIAMLAGVINVGLNLILIPIYGMMGAVTSVLISYLGIVVVSQLVFIVWLEIKAGIFRRVVEEASLISSVDQD